MGHEKRGERDRASRPLRREGAGKEGISISLCILRARNERAWTTRTWVGTVVRGRGSFGPFGAFGLRNKDGMARGWGGRVI